jgi:hypothetical protein
MNTVISIVIAIVLNFLGVEVQERKLVQSAKQEIAMHTTLVKCAEISAEKENTQCTSIKIEHKCKLRK